MQWIMIEWSEVWQCIYCGFAEPEQQNFSKYLFWNSSQNYTTYLEFVQMRLPNWRISFSTTFFAKITIKHGRYSYSIWRVKQAKDHVTKTSFPGFSGYFQTRP